MADDMTIWSQRYCSGVLLISDGSWSLWFWGGVFLGTGII